MSAIAAAAELNLSTRYGLLSADEGALFAHCVDRLFQNVLAIMYAHK